jgi:PAS domain S-box-containing protein
LAVYSSTEDGAALRDAESNPLARWTLEHCVNPGAIAGFFVFLAFLWTLTLQHVFVYPFLFLFLGAVMGSAWFGGFTAGLLSLALSTLFIDFFFLPPFFSMAVARQSRSYIFAFVLCSFAVSWVSSARKRSEIAIREARDQLETKVRERTAELLQSNLEIQESERRLRTLTEAIPQQMWSAGASGAIEYCNQHLLDYLGDGIEDLRGEPFFAIFHPVDETLFREAWKAAIEAGSGFETEARVRGADSAYRWFLIRGVPQRSTGGKIARWYGVHVDIEQQHRAQQGLVMAHDELSRLARALTMGEMAASIAHELNQPLTAVVAHAYACREWLRSEPANLEKAAATADKIVQESTRAGAVVARVRAMFRKDARVRESCDLNRLIEDLVRLLRDEAIRLNISLQLHLAPDLPLAMLDPVQIQQVLLNLAANAMDAMSTAQPPRTLTICSQRQGEDELRVAVEDTGGGLAPEAAARMFEPFFTTKPQGMGMGLAICRSIVEAHDGRLWAEPRIGGAAFHFTIRVRS